MKTNVCTHADRPDDEPAIYHFPRLGPPGPTTLFRKANLDFPEGVGAKDEVLMERLDGQDRVWCKVDPEDGAPIMPVVGEFRRPS